MPPSCRCCCLLASAVAAALAVHIADNGDGSFTNPVMPNAHWSDPSVVRVGADYYVVTSSIETTPSLQILHSTDLVNFDVVGSVSRHWFARTVDGVPLQKRQCWSPRLMHVAGKFRVMWHQSGQFMVAEAARPQGPWALVRHNLTGMAQPTPQWAASTYVDDDGKTYVYAFNWVRETDAAALNWVGPKVVVADMHARGVGLMENPSLMKRGGYYYWHESVNGTVTWGLAPDPNGGAGAVSSNKGALAVWRSRAITGPYEGPRDLLTSNVAAACVNTGTVVLGPDNASWYYLYDAIVPSRWNMQRQLFVDRISWGADGWPLHRTPGGRNKFPAGAASPPPAERWRPQLSDEFDGPGLEGVTRGVLGRKWLFKQENVSLWEVANGSLALRTDCAPGIESAYPANMLLQRPTAAYYRLETSLRWPASARAAGGAGAGGAPCDVPGASAGLIARELNTGQGIAVGLWCNSSGGGSVGRGRGSGGTLQIAAWQNTLDLLHSVPFVPPPSARRGGSENASASFDPVAHGSVPPVPVPGPGQSGPGQHHEIWLRIDVELVLAQVWYSLGGSRGPWQALPQFNTGSRGSEMTFEYASTWMRWEAVGADPATWDHIDVKAPSDAFTTLHPGLFAGGGGNGGGGGGGGGARARPVLFDYFRYTDNEVFPVDEV